MDNVWILCQVMADMKKVYDDLIIINLYEKSMDWNAPGILPYIYKLCCKINFIKQ